MTSDEARESFNLEVTSLTEPGTTLTVVEYFAQIEPYLAYISSMGRGTVQERTHYLFTPIYNALAKHGNFSHYLYPWSKEEIKNMNEYILMLWGYYVVICKEVEGNNYATGGIIPENMPYSFNLYLL